MHTRIFFLTSKYCAAHCMRLSSASFYQYSYVYFYDDLGRAQYIKEVQTEYFTPGSKFIGRDPVTRRKTLAPPPTFVHEMWTYHEVYQVLTNSNHCMHIFVQLCIEQGIMAPADHPDDAFLRMIRAAMVKAERQDELLFERISQTAFPKRRSLDSLRPIRAMSSDKKLIEEVANQSSSEQRFYSLLVDNIVRRQIIHS